MEIQDKPVVDSPNNDAFEAIVELYYQTKGYITSSGKWFWAWDEDNKRQRGYQDIDILALSKEETIVVSVSSNLNDKVSFNRNGDLVMSDQLTNHFDRIKYYLSKVEEYKWLVNDGRKLKCVVAYLLGQKKESVEAELLKKNISLLSGHEMLDGIKTYLEANDTLKIQNHMLRLVQMMKWLNFSCNNP